MTVEAAATQSFVHSGKFFNVLGLALKNAGLTIITLTLYRFWARTAMRRRLWSRAWIMDDPLEYTGTAGELFRGFLIALPCFFLPAIFVFYIAPLAMDPVAATWLGLGFYILAVPLMAAARFWMRRYQLSRTRWRGIRMGLAGSAGGFAFASSGWTILQILSLGWYTPVARMNRARLLWSHARFGDQPFEFVDDGEPAQKGLWWPFAIGWLGLPLAWLLAFAVAALMGAGLIGAGVIEPTVAGGGPFTPSSIINGVTVLVLVLLLSLFFWAPYNAAAMNRIASLISLDGARFRLKAKTVSLFFISLAGILITILSLGLLAPVGGFLQVRYVLTRLEIFGAPRFAEIGQSVVEAPRAGESLGDAFDLDMGVGII
jgi:uncharacterized membrane protein YjgN (DUF898 family)